MCFTRRLKEIKPNLNINSKEIVVYQPFKKNKIYFGQKIYTPRNFAFAITKNGKVLDILSEKIILNMKTIPKTVQALGLYKVDKKGKSPKYFECDAYFVNLNLFEKFAWQINGSVELEERHYGIYKISSNGQAEFKVKSPEKLLTFLLTQMGIISSIETNKIVSSYINERISRILEKTNPSSKDLYLKDQKLIKLIFEKLTEWLNEIGIELNSITLTNTKFPANVLIELKNLAEKPSTAGGWGLMSFEEWQANNPNKPTDSKPKFVTIVPTGKKGPFFKESMAPYFFEDSETEVESVHVKERIAVKPLWKGADEIAEEKNSMKLVNLNDDENND